MPKESAAQMLFVSLHRLSPLLSSVLFFLSFFLSTDHIELPLGASLLLTTERTAKLFILI